MHRIIATYVRRRRALTVSLGTSLALFFTLFSLLQLIAFEKLPLIVSSVWGFTDSELGAVVAALVVTAQVLGIPYLLNMQLSAAMRVVSAIAAFAAAGYWFWLGLHTSMELVLVSNSGLGGVYASIPGGSWLLWFGLGMTLLVGWYSYGLILESRE